MSFYTTKELYNHYAQNYLSHIPFEQLSVETFNWWNKKWLELTQIKNDSHEFAH